MLYVHTQIDELRVWWDPRNDKKPGYKYKVTLNDKSVCFTERLYYNFKNLHAGEKYKFTLNVINEKNEIVGETEYAEFSTFPAKTPIDVTKPPYNAVGDGVTDNTECIRKAFGDCDADKYLYFPMGVYICESVSFSGCVRIVFDTGAIMCNKEEANNL